MLEDRFLAALLSGNHRGVEELAREALAEGVTPEEIINTSLIPGMEVVGEKFKENEIFLPEVMLAARAVQAGLRILKPMLSGERLEIAGRVVIGTVRGDHHDIGKNLVGMMLEGAGFDLIDLGTDVAPESFVQAVREYQPDLVGLSALLTTTMPMMKATIEALASAGLRDKVRVMVGGAPVTAEFAERIGADGYAPDAGSAVELAKSLKKSLTAAEL